MPTDARNSLAYKLSPSPVPEIPVPEGSYVEVKGTKIHYVEQGEGEPVVFVHGNPTSSYLWRNVIPYVAERGRAIALDLAGMGRSGKPKAGYRYGDHYAYLAGFIEALKLSDITFVGHDWGAMLGFDYTSRNPGRVRRIAFMEGVLPPAFPKPDFGAMGSEMGGLFRDLKDPVKGREMVIVNNMFVERMLPDFINRTLGPQAMEVYRRPYLNPEDREPVLAWPREIPIGGEPKDVLARMAAVSEFMMTTEKPILLLYAEPGVLVPPQAIPWYVENIRNLETAYVGQGLHFIQEDNPDAIGRAIADWIRRN